VLECSTAKRSAKAAVKVCVDMARENLITGKLLAKALCAHCNPCLSDVFG